MNLWDKIVDGMSWLGGKIGDGFEWVGDQFQKGWQPIQNTFDTYQQGIETPEDYKKAFENANKSLANQNSILNNQTNLLGESKGILDKQRGLNNLYTGNRGYQNALTQGLQGANTLSGKAGNEALQAARNAGMTKAQAAALGTGAASNAFGNNIMNQQNLAQQSGLNAIGANQGLSGQYGNLVNQYGNQAGMYGSQSGLYGNLANMAQSEAQRKYGNAGKNAQTVSDIFAGLGNLGTNLYALSDERTKTAKERYDSLSKMVEGIPMYKFRYTQDAQGKYHVDNDIHNGIMAQDLEKNPITATAVKEDEDGIKHVDTAQLAMQAIGLIGDLSKRISELEEK